MNEPHSIARCAAPVVAGSAVLLFVGWPAIRLLYAAFDGSAWVEVYTNRRFLNIIAFTIGQALLSTVGTLGLAIPAALVMGNREFCGRRVLIALWSAPFVLPTVVVGAAFLTLLPERWERSLGAIVGAHIFFNVGMATKLLSDAWATIDPRLDDAAAVLGAPPLAVHRTILRGPLWPTLLSTGGLVGVLSITSFGIVMILGGPTRSTTETEIFRQATQNLELGRAAVLAIVQFVLVTAVFLFTTTRGPQPSAPPLRVSRRVQLRQSERPTVVAIVTVMTALTVLPLTVLIRAALTDARGRLTVEGFRTLGNVRAGNGLLDAPAHAFVVSARAALLATIVAMAIMLCLVGTTRRWASVAVGAPIAVSGAILGFGALLAFAHDPIAWRSRWWMVPVMQGMVALPYAYRAFRPAVDAVDPRFSEIAATLGAPPFARVRRITVALLWRPFVSAASFAAAVALGEYSVTSFLVRPKQESIPVAILTLLLRPGDILRMQAMALAVILAVITMALVSASSWTDRGSSS